jgi:hypothetical protein
MCASALLAAACSEPSPAEVSFGEGAQFTPEVADSLDNVGLGNAVTVDAEGNPLVSYLGFAGVLEEGEIPIGRPIGAPFVTTKEGDPAGAVLLSSLGEDGVWTRGAAAMSRSEAAVTVPYEPAVVEGLVGLTSENSNGTDVAVDVSGAMHVVWAAEDGVWYASGPDPFGAEQVQELLSGPIAGPIGRPSVAVDEEGSAWVAYTLDDAFGASQTVVVASNASGSWETQTVAEISCADCPSPKPTQVVATPEGPLVAYVDQAAGEIVAARLQGDAWVHETVATAAANTSSFGEGLASAAGSDGAVYLSYYTGGSVEIAVNETGSWNTTVVAEPVETLPATGNSAQTTGVAVTGDGTIYVAWYDPVADTVVLGSESDGFVPMDTPSTAGGSFPALAAAPDGTRVYLAWYHVKREDLMLGVLGEASDVVVAAPSPTPEPGTQTATASPGGGGECPQGGIEITASAGASVSGFDQTTLGAPADEPFTICFDNADPSVPHNFTLFDGSDATAPVIDGTETITGPAFEAKDFEALAAADYFYNCTIHPTTMTGTLTAG